MNCRFALSIDSHINGATQAGNNCRTWICESQECYWTVIDNRWSCSFHFAPPLSTTVTEDDETDFHRNESEMNLKIENKPQNYRLTNTISRWHADEITALVIHRIELWSELTFLIERVMAMRMTTLRRAALKKHSCDPISIAVRYIFGVFQISRDLFKISQNFQDISAANYQRHVNGCANILSYSRKQSSPIDDDVKYCHKNSESKSF